MSGNHSEKSQKQGRTVAVVIALAALLSILAPEIVGTVGLAPKYEILIYLMSLAAFLWAMIVTWKLWRDTRGD